MPACQQSLATFVNKKMIKKKIVIMESKLFNDCFGLLWIFVFGAQMNLKKGTSTTKNYMKIVSHILAGFLFVSNQDTPTAQKGQGFGLQLAQATV